MVSIMQDKMFENHGIKEIGQDKNRPSYRFVENNLYKEEL